MSDRKRTLHQIEFLTDGNAVLRFTDGHETLVPSGEVSEELCQIQGREWGANRSPTARNDAAFKAAREASECPYTSCRHPDALCVCSAVAAAVIAAADAVDPLRVGADASTDLPDALRALGRANHPLAHLCTDGADEIDRLRARIDQLAADNAALTVENNTATALGNDWEQAASLLAVAGHDHLAGCVYQLARHIDHLRAAITTHHATRWTAGRAVLSPPDRALYDAAGVPHRVLEWDAGADPT